MSLSDNTLQEHTIMAHRCEATSLPPDEAAEKAVTLRHVARQCAGGTLDRL